MPNDVGSDGNRLYLLPGVHLLRRLCLKSAIRLLKLRGRVSQAPKAHYGVSSVELRIMKQTKNAAIVAFV